MSDEQDELQEIPEGFTEVEEVEVPEVEDDIAPLVEEGVEIEKDEVDGGELPDEEETAYFYQERYDER